MRQLTVRLLAVAALGWALAACGQSAAGTAIREPRLPPQIAADTYARSAPPPSPHALAHPLPAQLTPWPSVPGDPNAGRGLFLAKGCGGCHSLTGLAGASGVAGPRLDNTVVRPTIAGDQIPTNPENLTRWIEDPASLKPDTTMPRPGVSQAEARDLAAFLYSLPQNR